MLGLRNELEVSRLRAQEVKRVPMGSDGYRRALTVVRPLMTVTRPYCRCK